MVVPWKLTGISTHTGPGLPVVARCQAFSSAKRMSAGSSIITAYFVIADAAFTMSYSWSPIARTAAPAAFWA